MILTSVRANYVVQLILHDGLRIGEACCRHDDNADGGTRLKPIIPSTAGVGRRSMQTEIYRFRPGAKHRPSQVCSLVILEF